MVTLTTTQGVLKKIGDQVFFDDKLVALTLQPQLVANGASSVAIDVSLSLNAVVEKFPVTVRVAKADWTPGANVATVRQEDISATAAPTDASDNKTRTRMTLDFGLPRTVGAIGLADPALKVYRVKTWSGVGFVDKAIYPPDGGFYLDLRQAVPYTPTIIFPSEVRTERLQIEMVGRLDDAAAGQSVFVRIPESPGDLELRINGGPPVWRFPGTVVPGQSGWSKVTTGGMTRYPPIDLGQALSSLTGDPHGDKSKPIPFRIALSSRVPGVLGLERRLTEEVIRYVTAVTDGFPGGARELKFAEEGLISVPLPLPVWAKQVEQVKFTVSAKFPPERVIPAVGPDPALIPLNGMVKPLAELVLDADHAACLALTKAHDLVELLGVRLPLRAEVGGAEVRVLLLAPDAHGQPGPPVEGGASKPATLEAASGSGETWTTFSFPRPVPLDKAKLPFVAVIVGRGRVAWDLAKLPAALTEVPGAGAVRRGPPAGPWQELPAVGGLALLRGRVRLVGHAGRDRPVAPLQIHVGGAPGGPESATPTPKGIAAQIRPSSLLPVGQSHTVDLEVTSLVAGPVTLRDVLVIVADA